MNVVTSRRRPGSALLALAVVVASGCQTPGAVGSACESFADCDEGLECVDPDDLPGGYCTALCDPAGSECPDGSTCMESGLCFADCASSDDCRDEYVCSHLGVCDLPCGEDAECPMGSFCAMDGVCRDESKRPPPPAGSVGASCAGPTDCDAGLTCLPAEFAGTCSHPCVETGECENATVCAGFDGTPAGSAAVVTYCVPPAGGGAPFGAACDPVEPGVGCASGVCRNGVCTELCATTGSCPDAAACEMVPLQVGTVSGDLGVCQVTFPLPPLMDVVDFGPYLAGDALSFELPSDAVSFTIVLEGTEQEAYLATFIEGPDGHSYVTDQWSFISDTDPIRTSPANRYYALTIPSTDRPGAALVGAGTYTFTPWGEEGVARVYISRNPAPTRVDINFYVVAGTDIAGDVLDATIAATHPTLQEMLTELARWYAEVGIEIGHVRWLDLNDPAFAIIDDNDELEALFASGRTDVPPASFDVFLVNELPGGGGGMTGGIAGGIPGGLLSHGNSRSAVSLALVPQGQVMGIALFHELGHQIGLFHAREATFGEDPLLDTPSCPDADPPTTEPCASTTGRNFMYWSLIPPLWQPDEPAPNCSFCPSQRALVRATPMTW